MASLATSAATTATTTTSILNTTTSGMVYQRLGNTGLKVSRICLGCMTYGSPTWQPVCIIYMII
jgi:hypothetical protein